MAPCHRLKASLYSGNRLEHDHHLSNFGYLPTYLLHSGHQFAVDNGREGQGPLPASTAEGVLGGLRASTSPAERLDSSGGRRRPKNRSLSG